MGDGDVTINVLDGGGSVSVPLASVQLVIGCASGGSVATPVATKNPNTLVSQFTGGPLVEAAALSALKGGTVLAMRAAQVTPGALVLPRAAAGTISGASNATPIVITETAPHGLITGSMVLVAGVGGNTAANGTFRINVLSATTYELVGSVGNGAYTAGGTSTSLAGIHTNAGGATPGTSKITLTGTPVDDMFIEMLVSTAGTIGVSGIVVRVSYDAGRHFGPPLQLGTANSLVLTGSGVTLNFAAGTLVANDRFRFATEGPLSDAAGINACLDAINVSQYAAAGWGSTHIAHKISGADAATIQTKLAALANTYFLYTRAMMFARDAKVPAAWGGPGETETTWSNALGTDFSALNANRLCISAGHYNMASAFQYALAGSPSFRRPLSFAQAARRVLIPPQRHDGRVRDGSLDNINVDPTLDPADGFIYHDEFFNPTLNGGRFSTARTRRGRPGFFINQPNMMSQQGSVFSILPLAAVMDVACSIVHQVGEDNINDDLTLNPNGTMTETDAKAIEAVMRGQLNAQMRDAKMISSCIVTVDRSVNVAATKNVKIDITIVARGYVLTETINIGYSNPFGPST